MSIDTGGRSGRFTPFLFLALVGAPSLSGCTSRPPAALDEAIVVDAGGEEGETVRDCSSAIWTTDALPADFPPSVSLGPLVFAGLAEPVPVGTAPGETLVPDAEGRYRALKYPTSLDASVEGPVWLVVPESQRTRIGLAYDPETMGRPTVPERADGVVRFEGCPGLVTQWNGGFVVAGATCATLEVRVGSRSAEPTNVTVPFGRDDCG